jgi:bifunctional non-homologous end joining protein LigD
MGLEGIVSKRVDAPYRSGRTDLWVKVKCTLTDDFVIVGYLPLLGHKPSVGSVLLARREENGRLVFIGKAGSGISGTLGKANHSNEQLVRSRAPNDLLARLGSIHRLLGRRTHNSNRGNVLSHGRSVSGTVHP